MYITGDLHGDTAHLKSPAVKKLKRRDTLIVLGDFGFLWDGGEAEKKLLKKLGKKKYNLLFIDGCHENFDLLREYPVVDYAGGRAKQISGRVHYLLKGEVYEIEGRKLLCFGGGESADRDPDKEGKSWWRAELPTEYELENCLANLKKHKNKVDYILTHDAPGRLLKFIDQSLVETTAFQNWMDRLLDEADYKKWYFARYHKDIAISPRAAAVFERVWPLE